MQTLLYRSSLVECCKITHRGLFITGFMWMSVESHNSQFCSSSFRLWKTLHWGGKTTKKSFIKSFRHTLVLRTNKLSQRLSRGRDHGDDCIQLLGSTSEPNSCYSRLIISKRQMNASTSLFCHFLYKTAPSLSAQEQTLVSLNYIHL